ncbi:hypothetical protein K492DRAFT_138805 [Lichtheimia hyalospora FSU 10163]|nr:hypothetical protein K492DRAFT_138805 [Lichtheimia hyalospora FSU 10163]
MSTQDSPFISNPKGRNPEIELLRSLLAKLEHFYRKANEDPMGWLRSIKRLRRGGISDVSILLVAGSHLKGSAGDWWAEHEDDVETWKEFEEKFTERYASKSIKRDWWRRLEARKQGEEESVSDLVEAQQALFQRLSVKDERMKIDLLCKALRDDIGFEVEREEPETYSEAVDAAKKEESLRIKYKRAAEVGGNSLSGLSSDKNIIVLSAKSDHGLEVGSMISFDKALNEMNEKFNRLEINLMERLNRQGVNNHRGGRYGYDNGYAMTCYNCGQPGHKAYQCSERVQHDSGKGNGQQ